MSIRTYVYDNLDAEERVEILKRPRVDFTSILGTVAPIVDAVATRGDAAVREYTSKFDERPATDPTAGHESFITSPFPSKREYEAYLLLSTDEKARALSEAMARLNGGKIRVTRLIRDLGPWPMIWHGEPDDEPWRMAIESMFGEDVHRVSFLRA